MAERDLTKGNITRQLIFLAVPIILANVLDTLYNITDTFWVGRLGADAVAAISLSAPLIFLVFALAFGLTVAGSILVGQYKGRKDRKNINFISAQSLIFIFIISLFLSVIAYFLATPLMKIMGASVSVLPLAVSFFRISALGFVFVMGFVAIQSLLRGVGEVKIPLYIVLLSTILNFLLDPLFIFGLGPIPALGVSGAAAATVGTEAISTFIGLFLLIRGKRGIKIRKKDFRIDFKVYKKMFSIGFPSSIEMSARAIGFSVRTILFAAFGTLALAAFGIATRMWTFIFIPALGLSLATTTMIAQNLGAKKVERAERVVKVSMILGVISLFILGVLAFIFSKYLIMLFIPNDVGVISSGSLLLKLLVVTFPLVAIQQSMLGTFIGAGRTGISMTLSMITEWVIDLPIAIILAFPLHLGLLGLMLAYPIADVLSTILVLVFYKKVNWRHYEVLKEKKKTKKERIEACSESKSRFCEVVE